MSSITRKAQYVYTLHNLSEFELTVIESALENHATKYSHIEGDANVCNNILEMIRNITKTQ